MTEPTHTTEWEVGVKLRIQVDTADEAEAVAAAIGQAVGMLPFMQGEPELVVRELPPAGYGANIVEPG